MSKVTIVNKSKPKQVQVPVADIPKMQFGDLLGWFERMAFERGDHPCVLARMPKVLEAAGVDPKSLSPTVLAKAVTATLPLAESYFRRSNLDPETNGNGRWPPGQFSRIVWLGQAIPSAPEMKCAFCGTEFRPTGNSTQMTGFKHLDPVYSCPKCGMGLNAATHAKSVVAEGPARVPLAGAHGTELRNDPQPGHGWKVGGISVERRGKTASGSPKYRVMGRRATKIIQWFGHDAWTVPDVMGALRKLNVDIKRPTVEVQMSIGRSESNPKHDVPQLTQAESDMLYALIDKKTKPKKKTRVVVAKKSKKKVVIAKSKKTRK